MIAVNVWSDVSVQPSLGATPDDPLWSSIQTGEEVVLAEQLAGFTERYPDVVVERVVARDRPVRVLSEYAETAQLIVVAVAGAADSQECSSDRPVGRSCTPRIARFSSSGTSTSEENAFHEF